ncbi:MAG: hypothetical protein J6V41_07390 [Kiritimatiellae bacterium]|nr:hypothetical protein [Kiritimatiellia bacterium]
MVQQHNKISRQTDFVAFNAIEHVEASLNYLTKMTDAKLGYLPYWFVSLSGGPAFAEHNRIDDAELVASWYEGISSAREILKTHNGAEVEQALYDKLIKEGWDSKTGLRFPIQRPWSPELTYCTIHEQAYVLSALVRAISIDPKDSSAIKRAKGLVDGLNKLVTKHTSRAMWFGQIEYTEPSLSFPLDVYILGKGFSNEINTGWGDSVLRNAAIITPLVDYYELTDYEPALELAIGLSNHLTTYSHYLNFKMEFFGHVNSALWISSGLIKLGRILTNDRFVARGKAIYDYVRNYCSAFGWVPEFMHWQLLADERCEASCIKNLMRSAQELVLSGFPEYWDDIHRFWRNHLANSQLTYTNFIKEDNSIEDTEQRTFKNMRERVKGAGFGASMPNTVEMNRFNTISGSSSAAIPIAMLMAWKSTIESNKNMVLINFPVNIETPDVKVEVGYPNAGYIRVKLNRDCRVILRIYPWMPSPHEGTIDGRPACLERRDDLIAFSPSTKGTIIELRHELKTRRIMENVGGMSYFGLWRGPEMVDILPHASYGYRLYQRAVDGEKDYPNIASNISPLNRKIEVIPEPQPLKETRLNRRRAPRS